MINDDITENVLQCGKEGVKQNIMEALDKFCDEYADEMYRAVEEIVRLRAENTDLSKRICVLEHALDVCEDLYVMAINGKAFEGLSLKAIMSGLSLHDFLIRWAEESIQQIEKDFAEDLEKPKKNSWRTDGETQ